MKSYSWVVQTWALLVFLVISLITIESLDADDDQTPKTATVSWPRLKNLSVTGIMAHRSNNAGHDKVKTGCIFKE